MVKKGVMLGAILLLLGAVPLTAQAQGETVRIEQVQTRLPYIQVYAYPPTEAGNEPVGFLNGEPLTFVSAQSVAEEMPASDYYFLVDCSTSTTQAQMEAVKAVATGFTSKMGEKDSLTLLAFGVEVEVLLEKEKDKAVIEETVKGLLPDKEGTVFFDAIAAAAELSGGEEDALKRKVAFVFSDSVDVNKGGYTKEEISNLLGSGSLPFYAFGFDSGTKEGLDQFGAVARQSGAAIAIVSDKSLQEAFDQVWNNLLSGIVYQFEADSNLLEKNNAVISLAQDSDGEKTDKNVVLRYWEKDTTAPSLISAVQTTVQTIEVTFSEDVTGAQLKENYTVKSENGDLLGIKAVSYDQETACAKISLSDEIGDVEVEISVSNITDVSMEKNKVAEGVKIALEGIEPEIAEADAKETDSAAKELSGDESTQSAAWFLLTILSVAAIAGITVSVIKKRGGLVIYEGKLHFGGDIKVIEESMQEDQVKIHVKDTLVSFIRLYVSVNGRESKELKIPVNGAVFVGRSEICEVYFDDQGMSRQHFVIEKTENGYLLTNLSETNGTVLNGVLLGKPRILQDGDRIEAGAESFLFYEGEGS